MSVITTYDRAVSKQQEIFLGQTVNAFYTPADVNLTCKRAPQDPVHDAGGNVR